MDNFNRFDKEALNQLQENRVWYLALGTGLVILGSLALVYSFTSTLISVAYLGLSLLVVGIFEVVKAFTINQWGNFFLHLLIGVLYLVAGFSIFFNPMVNAISLTLALAIFFIISGVFRMVYSLTNNNIPHKGIIFVNGLLTCILGVLLLLDWPISGLWALGTFMGLDAIFTGIEWIALAIKIKEIKYEVHED